MADGPEWFAPKRYGYGAGLPISWQGWAVLVGYFVSLTVLSLTLTRADNEVIFGIGVFVLTAVLIAICWYKGEPPGWRWDNERMP